LSKLTSNPWHACYGSPWPFGVTWVAEQEAYNFAIYSKHARHMSLLFFTEEEYEMILDYRESRFLHGTPEHRAARKLAEERERARGMDAVVE